MAVDKAALTAGDLGLSHDDAEPLDVLDLPQLYTKPSARILLSTLDDLKSQPPSWEGTPRSITPRSRSGAATPLRKRRKVRSEGVPQYLTRIIASRLTWIEDDAVKEQVWETASQRLSERSGRSAMGALSRTFKIPLKAVALSTEEVEAGTGIWSEPQDPEDVHGFVEITLHEPALTADNLGLKTWASSYLLAKRMATLRETLPALADSARVLELGAGTGLVGIAAAALLKRTVILTDLPDIVPNLERNIQANAVTLESHGAHAETAVLDWSQPASFSLPASNSDGQRGASAPSRSFPLILVADPIYSPEHPRLLVQAIAEHLAPHSDARVVVEMPVREAYGAERQDFRERMKGLGLGIVEEGEEVGFDDWSQGCDEHGEEEAVEVRCWWSIWGWR